MLVKPSRIYLGNFSRHFPATLSQRFSSFHPSQRASTVVHRWSTDKDPKENKNIF